MVGPTAASTPNPAPEFVALILSATSGARLYPLSSPSYPKHLLPVAGIPLLVRQLQVLVACGFSECIVALAHDDDIYTATVLKEVEGIAAQERSSYLFLKSLRVTLHKLPEECSGTMEALRTIEEASLISSPKSHVVVLPGDLVLTDKTVLEQLANTHRQGNMGSIATGITTHFNNTTSKCACTMLLADVGEVDVNGIPLKESAKAKKNGLSREEDQIEYIALSSDDTRNSNAPRVIWKQPKIDVEEDEDMVGSTPKLVLPKPRLRGGVTRVRTDWHDVHVYVLSPWVRQLTAARPSLVSIKGDLIPLLVDSQFHGVASAFGSKEEAKEIFNTTFGVAPGAVGDGDNSDNTEQTNLSFAVRAQVFDGSKVMRACTLPAYLVACRETVTMALMDEASKTNICLKLPKEAALNTKFNSVVMKGAVLGEKNQIRSSVVGSGTKLGAKCKLNNAVILNNTTMGENVILQNAVVGENCMIGENCSLSYVRVGHGKTIPAGTKVKGDLFMDEV
jgi:NDP-sugar pyrophosphorylase family protein